MGSPGTTIIRRRLAITSEAALSLGEQRTGFWGTAMNFLRVVIAALACMAPPGLPRAIAEEEPCSKPVVGAVHEPGYSFGYGWWFEGYSAERILVRCVINQNAERALFINWVGAGLQGFARPRSSMYVKEVHRDEQQEEYQDRIWYGANLRRLDIIAVRHPSTMRGPEPLQEHGHRTSATGEPCDGQFT